MTTQTKHLTKTSILSTFQAQPDLKKLKDDTIRGLYLYRKQTGYSWYLQKRISGRPGSAVDFKLGTWPNLPIDEARKKARAWASACEQGYDPRKTLAPQHKPIITISAAFERYLAVSDLEPLTKAQYRSTFRHFKPLWQSNMAELGPDEL